MILIYLVACICDTICLFFFFVFVFVFVYRADQRACWQSDDDMTFMIYAIILLIYFITHPTWLSICKILFIHLFILFIMQAIQLPR